MHYLSTQQAAEKLNVNDATIRRWCAAGKLKTLRVGRAWLIEADSLEGLEKDTRGRKPNRVITTNS